MTARLTDGVVPKFVELRQHTEYSIGHACGKLDDHVQRVHELGGDTVCITEVDTLRHIYGLDKAAKKYGVRPIFGMELSLVDDHTRHGLTDAERAKAIEGLEKKREQNKAIRGAERGLGMDVATSVAILAMNEQGLRNLFELSSRAWTDGHYHRPRFDLEMLGRYGDGLLVTVGGVDSVIGRHFTRGDFRGMGRVVMGLHQVLGDRLYLEIHPHPGAHRGLNEAILVLSERLGIPLVAVNDVRYVQADDTEAHSVTLCLSRKVAGKTMTFEDPSHPKSAPGYHLRTAEEVATAFGVYHPNLPADVVSEAIANTAVVADRCRAELDVDPYRALVPDIGLPEGVTAFEEVKHLCFAGWGWRDIPTRAARHGILVENYVTQLRHELTTFQKAHFSPYFLFVRDVIEWARSQGIMVGPGRGSAAGSLACYLMGITSIDPLEHGLMFERFLAPGRCFHPDMKVRCRGGLTSIASAAVGDEVWTRHGWRVVRGCHRRQIDPGEGLCRITVQYDGRSIEILATPSHEILIRDTRGHVKWTQAQRITPGTRTVRLEEDLPDVSGGVPVMAFPEQSVLFSALSSRVHEDSRVHEGPPSRATRAQARPEEELCELRTAFCVPVVEPPSVLEPLQVAPTSVQEVRREVRMVREGVHGASAPENVFQTLRPISVRSEDLHERKGRVSGGSWTSRSVVTGGGLRSLAERVGAEVRVRASKVCAGVRGVIHAGLLGTGARSLLRDEGMGRPGRREATSGQGPLREPGPSVGHCVPEGLREADQAPCGGRGVRADGRTIPILQNGDQGVPGMPGGVLGSAAKEEPDLREVVCQPTSEDRGRRDRGPLLREGVVTAVRREPYEGFVHDLTIECGEYAVFDIVVHNCDMPDIDVDFQKSRREEVVEYIRAKYGEDRVAHIATFGRMHGKGALKDVARIIGLPFDVVNKVTATFPSRQGEEKQPVRGVLEGSKTGQAFLINHPDVMALVEVLEGSARLVGVHAAGVVASPVPLWHYCPIETHILKGETTRITSVDMRGVEAFGLLKIDALGLKNLDVLADVRDVVEATTGERIDFEALTFDDKKVINAFTRQEFVGVFQYDAQSARNVCEGLTFSGFSDVAALTALNRPGCTRSGLTDQFRARRMDPTKIKPFHPIVDAITETTLGVLVYQEQVIRLFRDLAGFDAGRADGVRKKIGKKLGLDDEVDAFIEGAVGHGMDRDDATALMKKVRLFGEYAFNLCIDIETPVWTTKGVRHAGDIEIGDVVVGFNGVHPVYTEVRHVWPTTTRERIEITFDDGSTVTCSPEHRFPTNFGYVAALTIAKEAWTVPQIEWMGQPVRSVVSHTRPDVRASEGMPDLCGRRHGQAFRDHAKGERGAQRTPEQDQIGDSPAHVREGRHTTSPRGAVAEMEGGEPRSVRCHRGEVAMVWAEVGGISVRGDSVVDVRSGHLSAECPDQVWAAPSPGGLCRTDPDRSGRPSPFPGRVRERTVCGDQKAGSDSDRVGARTREDFDPFVVGRVYDTWEHQADLAGSCDRADQRPPVRGVVGRQPVSWRRLPPGQMVDFDVGADHTYALANGIVTHNSHACSYAGIAYWQMWCKVYHPKAFIWALMRNADDRNEAMGYVKEARRLKVPILPPDVNESGARWTIVDDGIRAGLADVKHVGKTATAAIEVAQPFTSISDLLSRTPGRNVTSRVLGMLIKAGAMSSLMPNTKWALEHTTEWLDVARRRKEGWPAIVDAATVASADLPDYGREDLLVLALQASPQGSGRHPMELYDGLMTPSGVMGSVAWVDLGAAKFWNKGSAFICGVIVQIKFRQVGDFGSEPKTEAEKKKKQWGRRFVVIHLEDRNGDSRRVKVPPNVFDRFQEVLEAAEVGQCFAMHVTLLKQYHSCRANYVVDLEAIRQKRRLNIPLSGWERCLTDHPVLRYTQKALTRRRGNKFEATFLITNSRVTVDRNGNEMAFFGIQDGHGNASEVIAFSSVYEAHGDMITVGTIITASVRKDRGALVLTDEGISEQLCRI